MSRSCSRCIAYAMLRLHLSFDQVPLSFEGCSVKSLEGKIKRHTREVQSTGCCTLHPTPYTLNPTHYTLHTTPYTPHPTPCTLHPAPYTLRPAPYTLAYHAGTGGFRRISRSIVVWASSSPSIFRTAVCSEPRTLNPEFSNLNPESLTPELCTLHRAARPPISKTLNP